LIVSVMEWAAGDLVPGLVRGIRVILRLSRVSITTLIDLVVYVICSPLWRQPLRTSSVSGHEILNADGQVPER
jgi:hypothetical protein